MKVYYSIFLLLCIAIKPLYFSGYVGYFELNKEYIIKKYCVNKAKPKLQCNGKCHLAKKITTFTTVNSSENEFRAMLSSFKNVFTPLYFSENTEEFESIKTPFFNKEYAHVLDKKYSYFLTINAPPPKVS